MQIIAYTNSSDSNVMRKQLSQIGTYTVKPTEQLDIEAPVFIVQYSAALLGCNYIKCNDYGRYYFAKVTTGRAGAEVKLVQPVNIPA